MSQRRSPTTLQNHRTQREKLSAFGWAQHAAMMRVDITMSRSLDRQLLRETLYLIGLSGKKANNRY